MWFSQLVIQNFRNIKNATITLGEYTNILYGPNGSGKTSVLEAIYFLSHAKSFRSSKVSEIIRWEEELFRVNAKLKTGIPAFSVPVGIERARQRIQIRYNNQNIETAAQLAAKFYIIFLSPDSHALIQGGPKERRKVIDWAWFHVEPCHLKSWKAYYHLLKQRNAALKKRAPRFEILAWEKMFVEQAGQLTTARRSYVGALNKYLATTAVNLLNKPITATYQAGWNGETPLADQLNHRFKLDVENGFTTLGPHRADLVFTVDGRPAPAALSRGQMKLLIYTLRLAEIQLIKDYTGQLPIVLIDDIGSELDGTNQKRLLKFLRVAQVQVFATTTTLASLPNDYVKDSMLFHVKHGRLSLTNHHNQLSH